MRSQWILLICIPHNRICQVLKIFLLYIRPVIDSFWIFSLSRLTILLPEAITLPFAIVITFAILYSNYTCSLVVFTMIRLDIAIQSTVEFKPVPLDLVTKLLLSTGGHLDGYCDSVFANMLFATFNKQRILRESIGYALALYRRIKHIQCLPVNDHLLIIITYLCATMSHILLPLQLLQAHGKYKQKGRDYSVEDGDIIFFKFNAGAGLSAVKKK